MEQQPVSFTRRREAIARAWDLSQEAVLIPAGLPVAIEGTDQSHDFHAHNEHAYLAGTRAPGSVLAFDPDDGWRLFAPTTSEDDRVWSGEGVSLEELRATSGIDVAQASNELQAWIEQRRGRPLAVLGNHDIERSPERYGLTSGWATFEAVTEPGLDARLSERVAEARRAKDAGEVAKMRAAVEASGRGHAAAQRLAVAGMSERQLQVEMEAEFFRAGAERTAYGSIVGSGANSAVLHFSPTARTLEEGDLVLIDAAAEWDGYAADITRVFPVGANFTPAQRDIYSLVLAVQESAIAKARPGVEFKQLHLEACRQVAQGLVDLGILRGSADDLVERDAHALFFPHGLGHMLGLATHDAGGCLAGRQASDRFGLKWLRADLPLEPGYVVTIEPGIYFIPALIDDGQRREAFADAVDWERVDRLRDFGGIRIEDDVLITEMGADVLSAAIPKSIAGIEAARAEALGR